MDYAKVIVPLKLDWEPFYSIPDGTSVTVGQRVRVRLAGHEYQGVVHATGETPDIELSRVQEIVAVEDGLAPVSAEELQMWEFISDYYMCTIGEVYNAAYPAARRDSELKKSRRRTSAAPPSARAPKTPADLEVCRRIFDVFADGKPALLVHADGGKVFPAPEGARSAMPGGAPFAGCSGSVSGVIRALVGHTVGKGRSVLVLTPDVTVAPEGWLEYNSSTSPAARRDVAAEVRSGRPCVVFGTRISVFLPFVNLGLVVVCDEHDGLYKQNEPSPRYNARDVAVKLASVHGADVLLCSSAPSLESLLNCINGKYVRVSASVPPPASTPDVRPFDAAPDPELPSSDLSDSSERPFELVDTTAEKRKNGMRGSYSRKLLARVDNVLGRKGRVLALVPWKGTDELEIELRALFPEARTRLVFCPLSEVRRKDLSKFALVALLRAEFPLGTEDFRADERCLRELLALRDAVIAAEGPSGGGGPSLVIQTADSAHPVFAALGTDDVCRTLEAMLPMRKRFSLPPYSRLVDLVFKDSNEARRRKMKAMLASVFKDGQIAGATDDRIRFCLKKNASLTSAKREIYKLVREFISAHRYGGFVYFDVDPLSRH